MDFSSVMDDSAPLPPSPRVSPAAPPAAQLPKIPLFSSLAEDELRRLIEGVEVRDFEEGDTILKQGESGVALYVVVRGEVEVLLEGPPQKTIATLGEGAFFGEMALLTDFPRSATVIAAAPTQCLEISRELAARVIADSPEVLKTLLRFFRDRMLDRFLATSELFGRFAPEDARALVDRFKFLEADPRTRLVKEGQRAPGLFLLLCGEAQVVQSTQPIAKLSPGDAFGEMSLLTRGPAIASIDTVTKCWVLELPSASFQEMMLTHPQLLEWVSELAERRRTQNLRGPEGRVDIL
jgi:CRP-like cAMP-binding protein